MDYRRYALPCAIFLLIALLPACGGGPPDAVVARFMKAMTEGNYDRARSCCTESFGNEYVPTLEQMASFMPEEAMDKIGENVQSTREIRETLEYSIQGNTARVWATDVPFMKYVLVKQGVAWKIDSIDFDESYLDMLENLDFGDMNF